MFHSYHAHPDFIFHWGSCWKRKADVQETTHPFNSLEASLIKTVKFAKFNVAEKKRKKETRKERERSGRVAENPAGVYLVHNSRAVTSQGSLNYNPVHYIWMSWLVYCWCEICSCNCGNAEFTEYKESTVAAGSPGEGSQIPTQASPYQALALSSTHG